MLINLASFSVFPQQPSQYSLSPHPEDLGGHPSLRRTLPLTRASMSTLSLRCEQSTGACARVDGGGLDDHTAIFNQFLDVCA
jgi:hypothetical protein